MTQSANRKRLLGARRRLPFAVIQVLGLTVLQPAAAQVILPTRHVVTVGSDSDVAVAGNCTLRQALETLRTDSDVGDCQRQLSLGGGPDIIDFDPAILPTTISLSQGELLIDSDVSIQGPGQNDLTIDGNNASRIVLVPGGVAATISDVELTRGQADYGGAIRSFGELNLNRVRINSSYAQAYGGGVYARGSTTIIDSHLSQNVAAFGAGIFVAGSLAMDRSRLANNVATILGGALYGYFYSNLEVRQSTLSGNSAPAGGAVAQRYGGTLLLEDSSVENTLSPAFSISSSSNAPTAVRLNRSVISDSNGQSTGIIEIGSNARLELENSTLAGSLGIRVAGTVALQNSTIAGAAGIGLELLSGSTARVTNSIIAGSASDDCADAGAVFLENRHNVFQSGDCTAGQVNVIFDDPLLGPLQENGGLTLSLAPLPGSPAIDAGNQFCEPIDQRGFDRSDGACDIGAIEVGAVETPLFSDGFEGPP